MSSRHNLHLTHLDESHFENGKANAEASVEALRSIVVNDGTHYMSVKIDGAPAIFCGIDPQDDKFFVGTKSVFNKNPKLYKTVEDIEMNEPAGKAKKLVSSFKYLKGLNIPKGTVLQGDLLWTKGDQEIREFEGVEYVTVHPNTLIYAWESGTAEAAAVMESDIGIVFHTTYTGTDLVDYSATFGVCIDNLNIGPRMWIRDANIEIPDFHNSHDAFIETAADQIGDFDKIVEVMDMIPSSAVGANIKTFYNAAIRNGEYPSDASLEDYKNHIVKYYEDRVIAKVKTEATRSAKREAMNQVIKAIDKSSSAFASALSYTSKINAAKCSVLSDINERFDQKVFVEIDGVLQKSQHEGFVVVNKETGNGFKLVDRQSFSFNNFSDNVKKGWQK